MINIKYTSKLRLDVGREKERVRATSIAELLTELDSLHGDSFSKWLPHVAIFKNGKSIKDLEGEKTILIDDDDIVFLLPVAGG
jgi:molybdopterin converting factor small subunit